LADDIPGTTYTVHSVNSGAVVCGPYEDQTDAKRELKRLTREAWQGRTAPSEKHPKGQPLSQGGEAQLMHLGVPQEFEIRTDAGVIL
jgi:hypothetical protein